MGLFTSAPDMHPAHPSHPINNSRLKATLEQHNGYAANHRHIPQPRPGLGSVVHPIVAARLLGRGISKKGRPGN